MPPAKKRRPAQRGQRPPRRARLAEGTPAPIFLTGRFRSGTTILWQALREVPGLRTYFEPLHDNLLDYLATRPPADPTHIGVEEYFSEYEGLEPSLSRLHRREFGVSRLCLAARESHPALERYLVRLIEAASPERAALKLVRADFRLPWLRARFPEARIVSIFRNPRDQWASIVRHQPAKQRGRIESNTGYDLLIWASELSAALPALNEPKFDHSYEHTFFLWLVSRAVADRYADLVIDFDHELQAEPAGTLRKLLEIFDLDTRLADSLADKIVPVSRRAVDEYADRVPFDEIEADCRKRLAESGLLEQISSGALEGRHWPAAPVSTASPSSALTPALALTISDHRRAMLSLQHELRDAESRHEAFRADLASQLAARDQRIGELEQQVEDARDANASLQTRLDRLQADFDAEAARRKQALDTAIEHARGLEAELETRQEYAASLEAELERREGYGRSLEAELETRQEYAQSLETELERRQQYATSLETELERRQEYAGSLESELSKLRADALKEISHRDASLETAESYTRGLLEELDKSRARAEESDRALQELERARTEERAAFEKEHRRRDAVSAAVHRLGLRMQADFQSRLSEHRKQFEAAEEYARSLETALREAQESAREELADRQHALEEAGRFVVGLQEELEKREATARGLIEENKRLTEEARRGFEARDEQLRTLQTYATSLEAERHKLTADASAQIRNLERAFSKLEAYADSLREENRRVRESARRQIQAWAQRLDALMDKHRFGSRARRTLRRWLRR